MTVSAFAPVCMKPPTLLVCVNEATVTAEHIQRDRRFCVNLLSERQIAVSQLCSRGNAPKFIDEAFLERTALPGGVIMPVLRESIASSSEERRVGNEGVSPCRLRWAPDNLKQ